MNSLEQLEKTLERKLEELNPLLEPRNLLLQVLDAQGTVLGAGHQVTTSPQADPELVDRFVSASTEVVLVGSGTMLSLARLDSTQVEGKRGRQVD